MHIIYIFKIFNGLYRTGESCIKRYECFKENILLKHLSLYFKFININSELNVKNIVLCLNIYKIANCIVILVHTTRFRKQSNLHLVLHINV